MRIFEQRGRIVRRQGVGTYVTQLPHVIATGIETLESIERIADRIGLAVETGDLKIRRRTATEEELRRFRWENDRPLVEISRAILADGRPVAFLIDILPEEHLPADIVAGKFRGSILEVMLGREKPKLWQCLTDITAVSASPEVARHLNIQRGDPLLFFEAWLYSKEGEIIDHTYSYFLPGTFRFHINRRLP
jgi:GntR family transcriptional regulator